MRILRSLRSVSAQNQDSGDGALEVHLTDLRESYCGDAHTAVEDVLREVQSLEKRQYAQSRFRRLARYLEPLIDFLMMYSPALDIIVQYDANPSAIVWGSLKALLKVLLNAVRSYRFIEWGLVKLSDILSISIKYEKMFEAERGVQTALKELYLEVLLFLQRIRVTVTKNSLRLVAENVFRSVDAQFQQNVRRLSRAREVFNEEVTFAHRRKLHNSLNEQQLANARLNQSTVQGDFTSCPESKYMTTKTAIALWLNQTEWSVAYRSALKKRTPGTGVWLLQSPLFQRWSQNGNVASHESRLLWIHGLPGAGKTVLSSAIIEEILSRKANSEAEVPNVAYSYTGCAESSHRTAFSICVSALAQLLAHVTEVPDILLKTHRIAASHGRSKISQDDEVFDIFEHLVRSMSSAVIVIDALDECTDVQVIVSWLTSAIQTLPSLRVVCLSRDTKVIRSSFEQYPTIRIDAASNKDDIDIYLASAIKTLPFPDRKLKDEIFRTLSKKAEGMFLLADLSIQTIRGAISNEDLQNILNAIPEGINQMYTLIFQRLSAESSTRQSLVQRVLRLICFSAQSMTWSELRFALSWNEDQEAFQKSREPFKETVVDLCCPLIEHQSETDTFRLVHFTLYEFLCNGISETSSPQKLLPFFIQEEHAQQELASLTLACVANDNVACHICIDLDSYPLLAYATKHWCTHLSRSPFDRRLCRRYLNFVASSERRSTWILRSLLSEERAFPLQQVVKMQKLLQGWMTECKEERPSVISVLNDTQRALFQLDKIQSKLKSYETTEKLRVIPNFERLVCVRDLAREYTMAGEIGQGVEMFESELEQADKLEGSILPRSCWLLNSLGILYDQQGKIDLARDTQLKALAIQENSLPSNHLDIVLTINELGRVARHMEDFDGAEKLHRRALEKLQAQFAESDLQIVWTKNALGRALLKQGRPDEAISLHQQALAVEENRFGRDHPHTLWTLSDIARCFRASDDIESAITVQQEVVERIEKTLGISNQDALWAKNSLGVLYELTDRIDIARRLNAEALAGQTKTLGADHLHTVWRLDKRSTDLHEPPAADHSWK